MTFVIALALTLALTALVTRRRKHRVRRVACWLWAHPATVGLAVVSGYAWHRVGFNWALVVAVGYTTVVVAGRFWWQRTHNGQTVREWAAGLRHRPLPKTPVPTALYRLYNADRELLYIGITVDPARRFAEHADSQPWWAEVALDQTRIRWFDDEETARAAETAAIRSELPRWNTVSNGRNPIRRVWVPQEWRVPRSAQQGTHPDPWEAAG